jgi:Tfp pilus assembly protein PilF
MGDERVELARELFQKAHRMQAEGELELAVRLYQKSIDFHPTAEAHTFLGWTYHFQGKLDEAIAECKKAIAIDPTFGNPYNDIGAYLIERGEYDEAIGWLEKAILSKRYESYHYPWYNLGRICVARELLNKACTCFEKALELCPGYGPAQDAIRSIRRKIQ